MTSHTTSSIEGRPLLQALADNWWLLLLRGIAGVLFGVLAFIWPGLTILSLTLLWGAYALVDGGAALWAAITGGGGRFSGGSRVWLLAVGVLGIAAGIIAFVWPLATAEILVLLIGAWAVAIGIMQLWGAIQLRKEIDGEWLLILSGAVSILFGLILMFQPLAGALAVVWMIGTFAIAFGIVHIMLAFRLRGLRA